MLGTDRMPGLIANGAARIRQIPTFPLVVIMAISAFSILMLYSISAGSFSLRCTRQITWIVLGVATLLTVTAINSSFWRRGAEAMYLASLFLLIAVAIYGKISMGAQRWLDLRIFSLQPSELMRVSLILMLAKYFSIITTDLVRKTHVLLVPIAIIGIPITLVLMEPDLGTAMMLLFVSLSIIFASGVQIWKLALAMAAGIGTTPIIWNMLHDYQKRRILMLFFQEQDPNGAGYHIIQSQIAIGSGGFWGKGLMSGTQCQLDFLPEKQTDFVFAALAEELGFTGCAFLILLYALLIGYNTAVIFRVRRRFDQILVFGINSMIFFYIFINISMICGILPIVGIPLPFFSYGGSALIVLMLCQGLIFAVDVEQKLGQERKFA